MNIVKHFAKSSAVYFFGNILTKLIIFFLLPLYTKYIPPEDFGYYDLSLAYMNIIMTAVSLDIWSTIMRFMFDCYEKKDKYIPIFNGLIVFMISFFIYASGGLIVKNCFAVKYLGYIFMYGLFHMLQAIFMFAARGFGKNMLFAFSGLINTAVTIILNIIFILKFKMDFKALYISACIGMFVQISILESSVKILSRISVKQFDLGLIKNMLKFALAYCANTLCYWFMTKYSKYVIASEAGISGNGLYAVAEKFTVALTLVTSCLSMAWQEVAYFRESGSGGKDDFYSSASDAYIKFIGMAIVVLLPVIFFFFPYLIHPSYSDSKGLVPSCLLVAAVNIYSSFLGNIFLAKKKTSVIFYSNLISAAVNMLLIRFMFRIAGLNGINISLFVAFLINIIVRIAVLKKDVKVKIDSLFILIFVVLYCSSVFVYFKGTLMANMICSFFYAGCGVFVLRKYILIIIDKFRGRMKDGNIS